MWCVVYVCVREFRITDGVQTECFGNHFKNCESAIAIISPCTSLVAASVLSAVMRCIQWVVHVCICILCVCVYTYWPASCCCSLSRRCNFFSSSLYFVTSCATTASICPDIALAASSSAAITRMQALSSNTIRERTHYTRVSKIQSFQSRFLAISILYCFNVLHSRCPHWLWIWCESYTLSAWKMGLVDVFHATISKLYCWANIVLTEHKKKKVKCMTTYRISHLLFSFFLLLIERLRATNEPNAQVWILVHIRCGLRWVVMCFGGDMMSKSSEKQVRSKWEANHKST